MTLHPIFWPSTPSSVEDPPKTAIELLKLYNWTKWNIKSKSPNQQIQWCRAFRATKNEASSNNCRKKSISNYRPKRMLKVKTSAWEIVFTSNISAVVSAISRIEPMFRMARSTWLKKGGKAWGLINLDWSLLLLGSQPISGPIMPSKQSCLLRRGWVRVFKKFL